MKNIIRSIAAACMLTVAVPAISQNKNDNGTQSDTSGYAKFKAEVEEKIRENEKKIAELKARKQEGKQEVIDKYNKKVADVEKRNAELKQRMANYKSADSKWDAFRREFNHDMKELGAALKDIGTNNVK